MGIVNMYISKLETKVFMQQLSCVLRMYNIYNTQQRIVMTVWLKKQLERKLTFSCALYCNVDLQ